MPETPLIACSIGSMTDDDDLVGARAGQRQRDVDRRRIGAREQIDAEIAEREDAEHHERHDEHRGEHRTADAEFRQHDRLTPARPWPHVHLHAVDQLLDVGDRDAFAGLDAAQDLDAIAESIADLQLAHGELVAVDDEDAVDAVAVLQRRSTAASATLSSWPLSMCTRANVPGLSTASLVRHERLERRTRASRC